VSVFGIIATTSKFREELEHAAAMYGAASQADDKRFFPFQPPTRIH